MDLKMRPSFAAKCFGCALHTATGGQWMTWICSFFLVFICFLIVSFPIHWAPILSRNKNLTLMRERGFDFHFPLRDWHIFFIFLLVQLIISVWRACDTIPGAACRARRERGKRVCTTPVFAQLSRSGLPSKKKDNREPTNSLMIITNCPRYTPNCSFFIKRPDSHSTQVSANKQFNKIIDLDPPVGC